MFAGARWVNENLSEDEVIVSPQAATFAYYSERQVLNLQLIPHEDGAALLEGMSAAGVRYLFLSRVHPLSRRLTGPRLLPVCDQLRVVAEFPPRTYLLGIALLLDDRDPRQSEVACDALEHFTENYEPDRSPHAWW